MTISTCPTPPTTTPDPRAPNRRPGPKRGDGEGGTSDDDRQPDDTGATGTLGDLDR
jgi:hypothetical protein